MNRPPNVSTTHTGHVPTKKKGKAHAHLPSQGEINNAYDSFDPSRPLTGTQIRAAAQGAANVRYGAQEGDINTGIHQSDARRTIDVPAWFQQYRDALSGARAASSAEWQQAAGQDTTPNPTGDSTVDAGNAALASIGNGFKQMTRDQGAAQTTLYDTMGANSRLIQAGASQHESDARQALVDKLAELHAEKGDYTNEYGLKLRGDEQNYLVNQGTLAAAGYKQQSQEDQKAADFRARYGISPSQAADGISPHENAIIRKHQLALHPKSPHHPKPDHWGQTVDSSTGLTHDQEAGMSPQDLLAARKAWAHAGHVGTHHGGAGSGHDQYGNTPEQVRGNQNAFGRGLRLSRGYIQDNGGGADQYLDDYLAKQNVPNDFVNTLAYWASHKGRIPQSMIAALHRLGVSIGPGHRE